jgi:hypothetical protein
LRNRSSRAEHAIAKLVSKRGLQDP